MSLLMPLGLLGLIGLIILIIIYIIKPNFQTKFISSTFIWRLSLKYKKKKIPLSKLRNILLFICQVLIITAAAFILTQPFIDDGAELRDGKVVLIVDGSASMKSECFLAEYNRDVPRIERAVAAAFEDAKAAIEEGYEVSLILASDKSSFVLQQVESKDSDVIYDAFETLLENPLALTKNTTPDIEGAMQLAEQITAGTPNVTVTMYTDTEYLNPGKVQIHDVKEDEDPEKDYNVAVLDVRTTLVENYYRVEIDVACYGANRRVTVNCDIYDVNLTQATMQLEGDAYCVDDATQTIVFAFITEDMSLAETELISESIELFSYDYIHASVSEQDILTTDNEFYLYGGLKPQLKIQYSSSLPNNYYTTALLVLKDALADEWDIQITEVGKDQVPATEGFDIYIFEHTAPATVPTDGLVIYTNAQNVPKAAGIQIAQAYNNPEPFYLFPGEGASHPIMKNVDATNISVKQFLAITNADGYIPLMVFDQFPFLLLKEDVDQKILFMPFSLHYSNLALTKEFPLILRNAINYFFPVTLDKYVYETGDKMHVDIKTNLLEVSGPNTTLQFESFPAEWVVENPGTYTLFRDSLSGLPIEESVFVKLPAEENNTHLTEDVLENPYFYSAKDSNDLDLLFYFALAMVMLLFVEWWLKSREQI